MPAPRGNKNAAGKRTERPRLPITVSLTANRQLELEKLMLKRNIPITEEDMRRVAKELCEFALDHPEDGPAIII